MNIQDNPRGKVKLHFPNLAIFVSRIGTLRSRARSVNSHLQKQDIISSAVDMVHALEMMKFALSRDRCRQLVASGPAIGRSPKKISACSCPF